MRLESEITQCERQALRMAHGSGVQLSAPLTWPAIARRIGLHPWGSPDLHSNGHAASGMRLEDLLGRIIRAAKHAGRQDDSIRLPVVGQVAAGRPILGGGQVVRMCRVAAGLFPKRPDYLLPVRDWAMRDAGLLVGDLLAVQQEPAAIDGEVVVARVDRNLLVRRLRRADRCFELVAAHPGVDTVSVLLDDDSFSIEGVVVGLLRNGFQR